MPRMRRAIVLAASLFALPISAGADDMDIALSRLAYPVEFDPTTGDVNFDSNDNGFPDAEEPLTLGRDCGGRAGEPGEGFRCQPHQWAFRNLVAQLGRAFAPKLLAPAETLGYNGFYIGIEGSLIPIDQGASYWIYGTEGEQAARDAGTAITDREPASTLFVPALHVRKGLPLGAEFGTQLHWMSASELFGLGLDVKVAPFEGFFSGVGYLPSIAARGSVTRLLGDDELNLTVIGFDVSASKAFGVWGQVEIAPFAGWQYMWIIADTEVVDFTPERDAWSELNPVWNDFARCLSTNGSTEADVDLSGIDLDTDAGRTEADNLCEDAVDGGHWEADWEQSGAGDPDDYNNNGVFDREDMTHQRLFGGIRVIWEHLSVTGEFAMDLNQYKTVEAPKQWNASMAVGLDW